MKEIYIENILELKSYETVNFFLYYHLFGQILLDDGLEDIFIEPINKKIQKANNGIFHRFYILRF